MGGGPVDRPATPGWLSISNLAMALCAGLAVFAIYTVLFGQFTAQVQRGLFLLIAGAALILLRPSAKDGHSARLRWIGWLRDIGLIGSLVFAVVYLLLNYFDIANYREGLPNNWDLVCYALGTAVVLEGVWRAEGMSLFMVTLAALAYMLFGNLLPHPVGHHGIPLNIILESTFGLNGVFGIALAVVANVIFIFVIYGAVLKHTGAGELFIDLAVMLTGRSKGGPAQSAIVASTLFGTINGSGPANVVSTGAFTIPLMKRIGYRPDFAGGVEATASCVGQIMPPIMGAGAFIMAEVTGIAYGNIMIAAIVPALLFVGSLMLNVRLRAARDDLPTIPEDQIPTLSRSDARRLIVLAASIAVIVTGILIGITPALAGLWGIAVLYFGAFLDRDMRPTLKSTALMLVEGGRNGVPLVVACAAIGIVIASISQTGLAIKFVQAIVGAGDASLLLAMLATAVCCLIVGMGLPTAASYLMVVFVAAPAVTQLGLDLLGAHLFIFYFAVLSAITPPVAICAYAAAGISGAPVLATAQQAVRLGMIGFVVPFMWVFNPDLLLTSLSVSSPLSFAAAFTVVGCFAAANVGYLHQTLTGWERILFFAVGIAALASHDGIQILALALAAALYWFSRTRMPRGRVQIPGED